MTRTLLLGSLAASLLLLVPAAAPAAGPRPPGADPADTPPSSEVFIESIDVNVVNVDVVVTDKSGRRVTGLGKDDFELREDDRPVDITNFYAVAGDVPAAPALAAEAAPLPAQAAPAAAQPTPDEQRLYLTLYLDNVSLTPQVRNRMIPALQRYVSSRLRPGDQLMVASNDGSLKIRQAPTGDAAALSAALDKAARENARGSVNAAERRRLLAGLSNGELPEDPETANEQASRLGKPKNQSDEEARELFAGIELYAETEYRQAHATLENLGRLVDTLSGLPGRKVLLYVGGDMSVRPAETLVRAFLNKYQVHADLVHAGVFDAFAEDSTKQIGKLVERANAHRVTFYTLGASTVDSRTSAEWGESLAFDHELETTERANRAAPLEILAAGTGGLVAFDPSDPGVLLDRMRDDLGSYYSLGYVPHNKPDGKSHKISVIPKDRSLTVRHREGFRAESQAERMASRTLSAMVFGVAPNPLDVNLGIEEEKTDDKGNPVLSVMVMFPMSKLVLLPLKHVQQGRIRIFVGTRDEAGRVSPVSQLPVPVSIPNEQLLATLSKTAAFRIKVAVRPGDQTLAVSVRDELGNTDSTAVTHYRTGSAPAKAAE